MVRLQDIFDIRYGNQLDLNKMEKDSKGIHFVGRSGKNNGVVAKVKPIDGIEPFPPGSITVALGGSVLSSFLQIHSFYTGQNVAVLTPHPEINLTEPEKIFYCMAIHANAFRFSACGREANRTLKDILVPDKAEIPEWVNNYNLELFHGAEKASGCHPTPPLNTDEWKEFRYEELFEIRKGSRLTKADMTEGNTPFIAAIDSNNGVRQRIGEKPIHEGNTITVNYNGSVAEAFYQPKPFWASDDVNVLYPKFKMDKEVALFLCALIRQEKYRFNYGRKWHLGRMNKSIIKLPVTRNNEPDWDFMRSYIKSLPFSSSI